jgi:hypothetical protein
MAQPYIGKESRSETRAGKRQKINIVGRIKRLETFHPLASIKSNWKSRRTRWTITAIREHSPETIIVQNIGY